MKTVRFFSHLVPLFFFPAIALASFEIQDGESSLRFRMRLRTMVVEERQPEEAASSQNDRFLVESVWFGVEGEYMGDVSYLLDWELRGHAESGGAVEARDLKIMYEPVPEVKLYAGQYRVPFSRQRLLPPPVTSMISRPTVAGDFTPGRDVGLMARFRTPDKRYTFYAGAFTGHGANRKADDAKGKPMWGARIEAAPLGPMTASDGDYEHSEAPLLLFGLNGVASDDDEETGTLRTIEGRKVLFGGDVTAKYKGFFLSFESNWADFDPDAADDFRAGGFLAQASYTFPGVRLEPRVLYDRFDPNDHVEDDTQRTWTYGINFLPHGHNVKVMAEYVDRLKLRESDPNDWKPDEIRLLFQIFVR